MGAENAAMKKPLLSGLVLTLLLVGYAGRATSDEIVDLLRGYVQLQTVNPPGSEIIAARYLAAILEREGVDYRIFESAPGRANLWARLAGGSEPAILLLHHMDVVSADASRWQHPPFEARLVEGRIYGRGTLDNKSAGIFHLQAFLTLHREGRPLKRDVIFLATADEEAGGQQGVGWLLANHPELFDKVGAVLNEGGSGTIDQGKISFGIEVTQKLPLWLRITAEGTAGHPAVPSGDSAPARLVEALHKLEDVVFKPHVLPVVADYLHGLAIDSPSPWRELFQNPQAIADSPEAMARLRNYDYQLAAQLSNTCTITRLQASDKINVIAPKATAEMDCRLLPDADPERILESIRQAVASEGIVVDRLLSFGPGMSTADNFLYRAIENSVRRRFPEASVKGKLNAGFTDSHFFRERGIPAYGFSPVILSKDDKASVHGDNENITLDNLKLGSELVLEILKQVVY